jgi:molybdopterin-guanine dinucleotide biosynthesis protein A
VLGGILLTGGASRRFGSDKAVAELHGEPLAVRGARNLAAVADVVVEVGPGFTDLPATREDPPGSGPLTATAAGLVWLAETGCAAPAIVLATDLPHVTRELLELIARWPASPEAAVVPVAGGIRQPLCARYPASAAATALAVMDGGGRSMMALLDALAIVEVPESVWLPVAGAGAFADVDVPADLDRARSREE